MAADLATLGLRLTNAQAIADAKATGAAMVDMGEKGETAARKIASSSNPVTEAIKKQAVTVQQARQAWAASGGDMQRFAQQLQSMVVAAAPAPAALNRITVAIQQMKAASAQRGDLAMANQIAQLDPFQRQLVSSTRRITEVGAASAGARLSVGRLANQFTSLAGSIAGVHPVAGNVLGVLGNFAIGAGWTLGIIAGITAIAVTYDLITRGARKAREENERLIDSMEKQLKLKALGPGGEFVQAGDAARTELANARQRRDALAMNNVAGWNNSQIAKEEAQIERLNKLIIQTGKERIKAAMAATTPLEAVEIRGRDIAGERERAAKELRIALTREATAAQEKENEMITRAAASWNVLTRAVDDYFTSREMRAAGVDPESIKTATEISVREAVAAAHKFTLKPMEDAARAVLDRQKEMLDEMQRNISTFFSDIFTKGIASFGDLFSRIKDMFLKLVADMIAARLVARVAGVLTGLMGSLAPTTAGAQTATGFAARHSQLLAGAGAGIAGGLVGYGVGSAIGSPGMGALGGAASGAAAGFMVGGPIGAVVGGLAGLAGGLIGGAKAAREHAKALQEAQAALKLSFADLRATVAGDTLGKALAQNASELQKFLLQINAALSGSKNEVERNRQRAEASSLFGQLAEQIKAQSAQAATYAQEDLVVRNLRATGQGGAADTLAFQQQQQREMQAAIDANRDATYLSYLATVQNNELIAYQNGLLATAMRNAPTGFYGVERYLGQFATRSGPAGYPTDGGMPPVNPVGPYTGPGGLRPPGGNRNPITLVFNPGAIQVDGKGVVTAFVARIDQTAASTGGAGSSRAQALELM